MEKEKFFSPSTIIDSQLVLNAKKFSEASGIFVFLVGALALIGWKLNIHVLAKISSNFAPIDPGAAIGLIFLGVSLWLLQEKRDKRWVYVCGGAAGFLVFILGLVGIVEHQWVSDYLGGQFLLRFFLSLGINLQKTDFSILFIFIFSGLSLVFLSLEKKLRIFLSRIFSVLVIIISAIVIIAYIEDIYRISISAAILLAISSLMFQFGVMFARPEQGLFKVFVARGISGKMARFLFPMAFFVPLAVSWLVEYGEHNGLYDQSFNPALNTTVLIIAAALLIFIFAVLFGYKEEEKNRLDEKVLKEQVRSSALAKDLEKFKLAVDNESDHVMITDPNGIILYVNKAAEGITGYTAKEIIGKTAGKVWGGHMPQDFYEKMWRTIKTEKKMFSGEIVNYRKRSQPGAFVGEITNRRKNGQPYTAEIKIVPILDEDGEVQFFVGVERDITKIKEMDQMKTDFISFVSHQLRTPLTVIKWNTEMLRNGDAGELTKEQKRYLIEVERGEKRMATLISSLLNISRLEAEKIKVEPKPTDVIELMSGLISEFSPYAGAKNCTIIFHKPDQVSPPINVDPTLFRQIISNLLANAAHYSKPGKCKIEVDFKEVKGYYQIDVTDEGIGIPASAQNKIFDKFFRADNAIKADTDGTGLGLYMVKLIVERSGGKIWFESVEGKGSVFHFTIPKSGMKKISGEKGVAV